MRAPLPIVALVACLLLAAPLLAGDPPAGAVPSCCNPSDVTVTDPHILLDGGVYHLYGEHPPLSQTAGAPPPPEGFSVWTSPDLASWQWRGLALSKPALPVGKRVLRSPEVVRRPGVYYMAYGQRVEKVGLRVCLAKSASPLGPFEDVRAPWCDVGMAMVDPHLFLDDDGKAYLYFALDATENKTSEIYVLPLKPDFSGPAANPVRCVGPSQPWEGKVWNDAPSVWKHDGTYFLLYWAGGRASPPAYAAGYATAKSPIGPWTKSAANPILRSPEYFSGPGHAAVTTSPDGKETLVVYQTRSAPGSPAAPATNGSPGVLAFDRLRYASGADGAHLETPGPTRGNQPFPSGAAPFARGASQDWKGAKLDRSRWLVVDEDPDAWRLDPDALVISTRPSDTANVFLEYAPEGDFEAEAALEFDPRQADERASVFLWQDRSNYIRLSTTYPTNVRTPRLETLSVVEGRAKFDQEANRLGTSLRLKIRRVKGQVTCLASNDGAGWVEVGPGFTPTYPLPKVGFGASGGLPCDARFLSFRVTPLGGGSPEGKPRR